MPKLFHLGVRQQNTSIHILSFISHFWIWSQRCTIMYPYYTQSVYNNNLGFLSDGFSHNCLMMSSTTIALSYVIVLLTGKEKAYWTHWPVERLQATARVVRACHQNSIIREKMIDVTKQSYGEFPMYSFPYWDCVILLWGMWIFRKHMHHNKLHCTLRSVPQKCLTF